MALRTTLISTAITLSLVACTVTTPKVTETASMTRAETVESALQRARSSYQQGNFRAAMDYAELSLRVAPDTSEASEIAAKAALATGDLETAIARFSTLQAAKLASPEVEGLLGLALLRSGTADSAKPLLLSALGREPSRWREAVALARLARTDGDADRARSLLALAETHTDKPALVAIERGELEIATGRAAEALAAFDSAHTLSNGRIGHTANRRLALAMLGRVDEALEGASVVDQSRLHRELGARAITTGRKTEAVTHLKMAQAISPSFDARVQELLEQALQLRE